MDTIVAFQGEHGAYSEQACRQQFGEDVKTLPCYSFDAMFNAAHRGEVTHIMLPVENSLAGMVSPAYDLLGDYDLRVQGEEYVKVRHCLVAPRGTQLTDIKRAKSHWQALAQCAETLRRMGVEAVNHADTAGAAKEISETNEAGCGALSSQLAAEIYDLDILVHDMQDMKHNTTRFFILGMGDSPRAEKSKTSFIFTPRNDNKPGALHRILGELAKNDINMTKLESRPRRNVPWHYRFFVDIDGHEDDANVRNALAGVLKHSTMVKILGSYPARQIEL